MSIFDEKAKEYQNELEKGMILDGMHHDYFVDYKLFYLSTILNNAKKVLDYGCGIGLLSNAIIKKHPNLIVHGFDISSESIRIANENKENGQLFFTDSLDELSNDYDVILLVTVLHHVPINEREQVMKNILNHLKPGGCLIVIEHNTINPLTRKSIDACPLDDDAVMLKMKETKGLMKDFYKVKGKYITFWPQKLKCLRCFDKFIGWIPFGAQYMCIGNKR